MNLYILKPVEDWKPWYDKAFGFVVRAASVADARIFAATEHGDEGECAWLDPLQTTCELLTADGEAGTVLRHFASA